MTAVILRRRKLGRTSCREVARMAGMLVARNWIVRDWQKLQSAMEQESYVFRWGCTASLEDVGRLTVVNTAKAISWCSDKKQGRLDMQNAGVPVPTTFGSLGDWARGRVKGKKYVLRPQQHAQGRNLLVAEKLGDMAEFVEKFPEHYISGLVDKTAEYRVFVCQGRVVWVAQKTPGNPEDVAWNVARGGRFDNVRWKDWNTKVLDAAIRAAKVSTTDFCGVDVMLDKAGLPYVLEVNSAPSQTSPYRQQCVAKAFAHIVANGKQHFEDVTWSPRKTWKSYIHPAVRGDSE